MQIFSPLCKNIFSAQVLALCFGITTGSRLESARKFETSYEVIENNPKLFFIRVFLQPAPCLAPCLVNFSLYKYGAIRSSAPFHLVNLTRSYTELTRSRPQIAPCLAPYGSVFSSVLGKSDKIFKIWKKSKRLKSALNTQLSMKE